MSTVGQRERATQNRVVQLFQTHLGYRYLGNWEARPNNRNIEADLLRSWLTRQGVSETLIAKALRELDQAAALGDSQNLYDANKAVYGLLRYGIKVKAGAGEQTQTVPLIDWQQPENNDFALAEEVTLKGQNNRRPDLVLYVNGIALGILELKKGSVDVAKGIRQNLDNQRKEFNRAFFTTQQLVMAGNDTQGLRYGTIETAEKYYLTWKEENPRYTPKTDPKSHKYLPTIDPAISDNALDTALVRLCAKGRLLELIHDFTVFDAGIKKTCRHNQYFGIKAAQQRVPQREGGIIWHTQGSGKSLTMVWLAKWLRENATDARVLIITDRTELDEQIEGVFHGVDEAIYRTTSGTDLIAKLNSPTPWLLCSLVHKFGNRDEADSSQSTDEFIQDLQRNLPSNFSPKGNLFVFVDECHRTQSGKLHTAMTTLLPGAMFIGFTGTPLLKADQQTSLEVFGTYIHTYKFDEAVSDGVVLDLRYEARDIDQHLTSQQKVDQWFEAKTRSLSELAKSQLKKRWGTMRNVLSSQSRLEMIANDILMDMETKPRLMDGRGNAILVCASIYQACKIYEIFSHTDLAGKCAIVTSYKPGPADIKGEETGEGETEKLNQYAIYRRMLAEYFNEPEDRAMHRVAEFEQQVKDRFKKEPGQMRLLIVVDKLLTGFDAPSATYLYIDKNMQDHGLFQAICRVNRLDGDDKEYGYIVDYKDLFKSLEGAITDYTSGAFENYDAEDVAGLLCDRIEKGRDRLEDLREQVKALCEPVRLPRERLDYLHYFCAEDTADKTALAANEPKRVALYQVVAALVRAYANLANEMAAAGYSPQEIATIQAEVKHYETMGHEVKIASGDYIDMKQYEPAMRRLLDSYIRADPSETISDLDEMGLIDLIVQRGTTAACEQLPKGIRDNQDAVAETIENNLRRVITEESPVNPKYYDRMSELLDALIQQRRQQAISYQEYLEQVKQLAGQVKPAADADLDSYPTSLDTPAKRSLYDNLGQNEALALRIDTAVRYTKKADWIGNKFKEREVARAVREESAGYNVNLDQVMELLKNQREYQ
ncbi:type I restriction endonuclease subunit R [Leptolyngbya sp. PCC 6406]|uniref:type I restriction endonuclease subunit R n=1 Tax=Leptolyngbya sp. PCC 6406 TaxID=1173264 RepID=UPI0002AC3171|nr:type I restriction endonuclease subunit R [Leptolyngbya sp. PCC 6406]